MKIVSQASILLGKILKLVSDSKPSEAQDLIDQALTEYIGLNTTQVDSMSYRDLIDYLGTGELAGIGRLIMLTDLLRGEAAILHKNGDEAAAIERYFKSIDIRLELAMDHEMQNAHLDGNIDQLLDLVEEYELPTHTAEALFSYFEKTSQFDRAENMLFELIDDHITNNDMVQEGLAFYERLLRKPNSDLEAGNLPREEIEAGFDELWERSDG